MHTEVTKTTQRRTHVFKGWWLRSLLFALGCCSLPGYAQDITLQPGRASVGEERPAEEARNFDRVLRAQAPDSRRPAALPTADELPVPPLGVREPMRIPATAPLVAPDAPVIDQRPLYLDATKPDDGSSIGQYGWKREILPGTLLWQPPLANPLQPRFRIMGTNLTDQYTTETLETAIGGTMPMVRWTAPEPRDLAWQLDFFALALSRWAERDRPAAQDYRYGVVVTGASGNWSWKIAYEHTSCHVGDEQIAKLGTWINRDSHIREEAVLGLSYTAWEQLRIYAIFGYAFAQSLPNDLQRPKSRYNLGLEWLSPTRYLRVIQPFAAMDFEFRGDQDYVNNACIQLGIRVQAPSHRAAVRFGLEYYHGNSFYGQYFDHREHWAGMFAAFDY